MAFYISPQEPNVQ